MFISVQSQWMSAIYTLYLGVLLGALYDVFRSIRWVFSAGRFATLLLDACYCICILPITTWMFYRASALELAPWMFIGILGGMSLYFYGPSPWFMRIWRKIFGWLHALLHIISAWPFWRKLFR